MNTLTQISVAAFVWTVAWATLCVVCIRLGRWSVAFLSGLLAAFFGRYALNTLGAAGHDTSMFSWANNRHLILVQIIAGVILTISAVVEMVITQWPRRT